MKDKKRHTIVMTGTSEQSGGGITSVIRLIKKMPVWEKYNIYWLETQADGGTLKKLWWVIKAALKSPILIARCKIVHFQMVPGITLFTQLPALLVAKIYRKKVVMTVHVGNQLELYAKDNFFKWWFRRADLVLLLAKRWEKLIKESYADVKVHTDILYNACEVRPYIPMEKKSKLILFVGTHDTNKAPDLLLNAWVLLKDKYSDWRIIFCGSGNVSYYEKMADELGLSQFVDYKGYVVGDEKELLFHDASILCLCSYMEGFPMAVLEAWSHSIAVVTTPVGGLPDAIAEENCLTFPVGKYESLAKQLGRLIEDDELRKKVATGGHQYATEHFSLEVINEKLDGIYSRMTNN